jgi:lipid A 4'-phosphatase
MSLAIFERAGARERLTFGSLTSAVFTIGLALAAVFFFFPDIDLQFARMFYRPGVGFTGNAELAVSALRWFFIGFYYSCIALTVVGLVRARAGRRSWLKLRMAQWLFLATCLGVGPGLVANVLLKQQVGRARPQHLVEFGGTKAFTAPFVPARECRWACRS